MLPTQCWQTSYRAGYTRGPGKGVKMEAAGCSDWQCQSSQFGGSSRYRHVTWILPALIYLGTLHPTWVALDLAPNREWLSSISASGKSAGWEATWKVLQEAEEEGNLPGRRSWQDNEKAIGTRREVEDALTFDGNEACLISCVRGERKPWASFNTQGIQLGHLADACKWCLLKTSLSRRDYATECKHKGVDHYGMERRISADGVLTCTQGSKENKGLGNQDKGINVGGNGNHPTILVFY